MLKRLPEETPIDRFERECNDDFRSLAELGPEYFSAEHLVELRDEVLLRISRLERLHRLNFVSGAVVLSWALVGAVAMRFAYFLPAQIAFFMMLLAAVVFIAGIILVKSRYESKNSLRYTFFQIEEELRRRGVKRSSGAKKE